MTHARQVAANLGVDRNGQIQAGGDFHPRLHCRCVGPWIFIESGVTHEGLEADRTALRHGLQVGERVRRESCPEREIQMRFLRGDEPFFFQRCRIHDRGRRVQRHVKEGRAAGRREREASGFQAFPLGPAGLVEMHMGIDPPWNDPPVRHLDHLLRRTGQRGTGRRHQAVDHAKAQARGMDQKIEVAHAGSDFRNSTSTRMPTPMSAGEAYSSG